MVKSIEIEIYYLLNIYMNFITFVRSEINGEAKIPDQLKCLNG